jgi:lysophospholipase L1-like esterase
LTEGLAYEEVGKLAVISAILQNNSPNLPWVAKRYYANNKTTYYNANWKTLSLELDASVKYIALNVYCNGGATWSFLEDESGNTLKSWGKTIIQEIISLTEYPTAKRLLLSADDTKANSIALITDDSSFEAFIDSILKTNIIPNNWVSGGYYNNNKNIVSNESWETIDISVDTSIYSKIKIDSNVNAWAVYGYLLNEDGEILKSWNFVQVNEIVDLSDYPTAKRLLMTNRKEYTRRSITMQYRADILSILINGLFVIDNLDDRVSDLEAVDNYRMGCICPIKLKATDHVLFAGDSISYGQGAGTTANRWVNRVCAAIGCTFKNNSVAGAAYAENKVLPQISSETLSDYTYIVIAAGINDTNRGYTKTQIQSAVGDICDYINAQSFTGHVLFITPANEYRPKDARAIYSVEQVRRFIYDKVVTYGFYVLDGGGLPFSNVIGDESNSLLVAYQSGGETIDGLHPNTMGHLVYSEYFLSHCANL